VTAAEPAGNAARRAALLLHAMAPADQAWMLAALPAPQRARLDVLLAELHALGIPADSSLLRDLTQAGDSAPPMASQRLLHLDASQVRTLAEVLASEPPQIAAWLLASKAWPWRDQLVATWNAEFRARVVAAAPARSASAANCTVCGLLLQHLETLPAGSAALPPWQRLRRLTFPRGARP
jgi:hypothetical protein